MAVSSEFLSYITDLMADFGDVSTRRMFGGAGIYKSGLMFALVADDHLYMKVDDDNRAVFEKEGLKPFLFRTKNGKESAMSYYEIPERALEIQDELVQWARLGFEAALRAKSKSPKRPKPKI